MAPSRSRGVKCKSSGHRVPEEMLMLPGGNLESWVSTMWLWDAVMNLTNVKQGAKNVCVLGI